MSSDSQFFHTNSVSDPVPARLKWFNTAKGFGFVVPENDNTDAFLHITVLQRAGVTALGEGATVLCRLNQGDRGTHVSQVVAVLDSGSDKKIIEPTPELFDLTGSVKWYKPDRGYGFVSADDRGKDILLPCHCLKRHGWESIEPRTPVLLTVKVTPKGREAVDIQILEE